MKITTISFFSVLTTVGAAFAQQVNGGPLLSLLALFQELVARAVPFLIGLAMVVFFYGLVMFVWKGKEGGEGLEKAKHFMMYSILAIFVMVSIWGIVTLMQRIVGIDPGARPADVYVPRAR
jgi:Na+/H+-dicarboxylate symporter